MEEITEAEVDAPTFSQAEDPGKVIRSPPGSQFKSQGRSYIESSQPIRPMASYSEKAVGSSPKRMVSTLTSPIEQIACSVSREHALKLEIEQLQERLKDTEERLASVRLQSDSLSQTQRALREHNSRLQEESEMLKLDVQHLNECANVLRSELQAARRDRGEALQMQGSLREELEEAHQERRRTGEGKEKDSRVIQDLQRQCREMERILMRKHPDSVSALIVASKSSGMCPLNDQENVNSRKLLEQRIAQLESDAKEQDRKAQQILANVQARFNSVQAKYETHIADLETQVLSLQEINTKLNEQIESQVRTLDRYMQKRADRYYNNCTQTEPLEQDDASVGGEVNHGRATPVSSNTMGTQTQAANGTRDHSTNTIGCPSPALVCQQQHLHHAHGHLHPHAPSASSSTSSTANSTPNTSRPNSKQSGGQRRSPLVTAGPSKLPISQSDSTLSLLSHGGGGSKEEAQLLSSVRSMRVDLAIKNKAMQRLTRELDECKKTIRKLQRDKEGSGSGSQTARTLGSSPPLYPSAHCLKRRKVPVDYYALKAQVSLLERRHSEREERLHMLVEALSKGRLNGALEDLMQENNNK
ncbi:GD16751 [Drosophila simulans]|uniref:Centrosomal protein of 162 kDa n=1 Tax=Drosophila simulans TaxID=7240 RepID=B4R533_DROSI|nr:GD16751 [Drosophila simulans]